jgi:chromate transporter
LFWVFLKAGALMFGSGYVLLAFIHDDLVLRLGWLTDAQLVDAIAIGQVTPGPLSTTATFVGYLLGGVPAAILATVAMFLPSFIFVGVIYFAVTKLRESEQFTGLIDGINFAALGLMAGVTWEIAGTALVDPVTVGIALVALYLLLRYELGAPWLILGSAAVGLARLLLIG